MIHDGMPISLDKIARSEPFAGGPYKADISAYSCRMWNELSNRLIHNLSCSLSHVKEESGRWNEASWCRSMHLRPCTCPPVLKTIDYCGVHGWGDNLHYYTGFPVADNYMYYIPEYSAVLFASTFWQQLYKSFIFSTLLFYTGVSPIWIG